MNQLPDLIQIAEKFDQRDDQLPQTKDLNKIAESYTISIFPLISQSDLHHFSRVILHPEEIKHLDFPKSIKSWF